MTSPRPARTARAVVLGVLALAVATPVAGADGVRVSVSKGFPVSMTAAPKAVDEYDVNPGDDPTAFCRGGAPLTVGWTGARAPIAGTTVYPARGTGAAYVKLDPRRPRTAGSIRAIAVCATGSKVRATTRISLSGTTVGCGAKLTLGLAATESWPYIDTPVTVGPSGSGWNAAAGPRPRPTAICVARSAFRRVTDVRARGAFAPGRATATVTASCPRGRRALAWGYEASPISGNAWRSVETRGSVRSTPFVGDAVPTAGAKGFRVTFRTADDAGATSAAPVTVHVRCGAPAA